MASVSRKGPILHSVDRRPSRTTACPFVGATLLGRLLPLGLVGCGAIQSSITLAPRLAGQVTAESARVEALHGQAVAIKSTLLNMERSLGSTQTHVTHAMHSMATTVEHMESTKERLGSTVFLETMSQNLGNVRKAIDTLGDNTEELTQLGPQIRTADGRLQTLTGSVDGRLVGFDHTIRGLVEQMDGLVALARLGGVAWGRRVWIAAAFFLLLAIQWITSSMQNRLLRDIAQGSNTVSSGRRPAPAGSRMAKPRNA